MNQCKSFVRFAVCVLAASACVILAGDAPGGVAKADGEQFTFTVPVRLSRIHSTVRRARVIVRLYDQGVDPNQGVVRGEMLGNAARQFDIPGNGEYSGEIVVSFNLPQNREPSRARGYKIAIQLENPREPRWDDPTLDDANFPDWQICHPGDRLDRIGNLPTE